MRGELNDETSWLNIVGWIFKFFFIYFSFFLFFFFLSWFWTTAEEVKPPNGQWSHCNLKLSRLLWRSDFQLHGHVVRSVSCDRAGDNNTKISINMCFITELFSDRVEHHDSLSAESAKKWTSLGRNAYRGNQGSSIYSHKITGLPHTKPKFEKKMTRDHSMCR